MIQAYREAVTAEYFRQCTSSRRLKDLGRLVAGGTPKSTEPKFYSTEGHDWVQVCDVPDGEILETEKKLTDAGKAITPSISGYVVVLAMKASVGKVGFFVGEKCLNEATLGVSFANAADQMFVFYALKMARRQIESLGRGGTQSNTNADICRNIVIPWASPEVRRRIAEELLQFEQRIPDPRSALDALDAWYQSEVWHLVTGKREAGATKATVYGEMPVDWQCVRLKHACVLSKGETPPQKEKGDFPYYNGGIKPTGLCDAFNVENETILLSNGGASAGKMTVIKEKAWIGGDCYIIKPQLGLTPLSFSILEAFRPAFMQGSAMPHINKDYLDQIWIPVPPMSVVSKLAEQLRVLERDYVVKRTVLEELAA